jgi:acrylyl-CoA reductase (NADPH)
LAELLEASDFDDISHVVGLEDVVSTAGELLAGNVRGRVIVDLKS